MVDIMFCNSMIEMIRSSLISLPLSNGNWSVAFDQELQDLE
jgi:hypothetical protein